MRVEMPDLMWDLMRSCSHRRKCEYGKKQFFHWSISFFRDWRKSRMSSVDFSSIET